MYSLRNLRPWIRLNYTPFERLKELSEFHTSSTFLEYIHMLFIVYAWKICLKRRDVLPVFNAATGTGGTSCLTPSLLQMNKSNGPLYIEHGLFKTVTKEHCSVTTYYNANGCQCAMSLQWRHNGCDSVSNHQPHHCLRNSGADQRKHQSSESLAFVRGIHRRPVNSPHKWPVKRKKFPFDDVIM